MADTTHVLLRADASSSAGTGHVVRCLTLAGRLVERGWRATLAGRMPPDLARVVAGQGVRLVALPDGLPVPDEPGYLAGTDALDEVDVVVADHYGIDATWHRAVRGPRRLVAAIDDLAAGPLAVDLVLNQNLGATPARYRDLVPPDTVVLTGPMYAILRPAFAEERGRLRERDGAVRRVLVFLSGADEHDVTGRAAAAAAAAGLPVDVVVGSAYAALERLEEWAADQGDVRLHVNTPDMPRLMVEADLAIGAPSSASWERCTLGLPSVLVILAENQVEVGGELQRAGAARTLGWHDEVSTDQMTHAIADLASDAPAVRAMGRAAAAITDGAGAARVADALDGLVAGRERHPRDGLDA